MKRLAIAAALLSALVLSVDVTAAPPGKEGAKTRDRQGARDGRAARAANGPRAAQAARNGQAARDGQGARAGQGARRGQIDPAQIVARMMKEFDQDGDEKLDLTELTSLLTDLRDRRGETFAKIRENAGEGKGRANGRPDGARGKRDGEKQATAGGETPKRPPAQ